MNSMILGFIGIATVHLPLLRKLLETEQDETVRAELARTISILLPQ